MKKFFPALVLTLAGLASNAQTDMMVIHFKSGWGHMSIVKTDSEAAESLDFTTIDKKDSWIWMRQAILKVKEQEGQGWKIEDFEIDQGTFVWILRR